MKKIFTKIFFFSILFSTSMGYLSAQNEKSKCPDAERAPAVGALNQTVQPQTPQALWTVLFNYNLLAIIGSNGNAGVCFFNNEFWVARWQNDSIFRIDASGTLVQRFTVPGVTGIRALTTDGTYIYAGLNTSSIPKIDPTTKTVVSTITAPVANARSLTYDPTVAGGGFWASTWNTDIVQFNMSGVTTSTIPASSHLLTGMYGTAYDNISSGGPYLWIFDQAHNPTNKSDIVQLNIASQTVTGIYHDVMSDVGLAGADTSGLAGGIFFSFQPPLLSVIGVLQGAPTNRLFGYEVGVMTTISENPNQESTIGIFPNPVKDLANISLNKQGNEEVHLEIFDITGKIIFDCTTRATNNYINFSNYTSGMYFVKASCNGKVYTTKLVKE